MAEGKVQGRMKCVHKTLSIMPVAPVSANSLQICWCEGFEVAEKRVLVVLTRR